MNDPRLSRYPELPDQLTRRLSEPLFPNHPGPLGPPGPRIGSLSGYHGPGRLGRDSVRLKRFCRRVRVLGSSIGPRLGRAPSKGSGRGRKCGIVLHSTWPFAPGCLGCRVLSRPAHACVRPALRKTARRGAREQSFDLVVVNSSSTYSLSIPYPWGGSYTFTLQAGLNNLLIPREQFLNSSFAAAVLLGRKFPYPAVQSAPANNTGGLGSDPAGLSINDSRGESGSVHTRRDVCGRSSLCRARVGALGVSLTPASRRKGVA
jgi:hypothetical protein